MSTFPQAKDLLQSLNCKFEAVELDKIGIDPHCLSQSQCWYENKGGGYAYKFLAYNSLVF